MCGICLLWGPSINPEIHTKCLENLTPRGPDVTESHFLTADTAGTPVAIGFTRLHIQGSAGAEQPFALRDGRRIMCNGEIFNSDILIQQIGLQVPEGASDCAVIPALLEHQRMSL